MATYEVFWSLRVTAGSPALAADQAAEEIAGLSLSDLVSLGHIQPVEFPEVA